jgi:phosphate:Na+ symporter
MTRNLLLLSIFAILGYGFWINPDFKTITAGVAIFLLGMLSLEKGFKSFSGGVLASFPQRTTYAIGIGIGIGIGIAMTVVMQSSHTTPILT